MSDPAKDKDNADDLLELLDASAQKFEQKRPNPTSDDDLDQLMEKFDNEDAKKAASQFQHMLHQMVTVQEEVSRQREERGEAADMTEDDETKAMMAAMSQLMDTSGKVASSNSREEFMEEIIKLREAGPAMDSLMHMIIQTVASKDVMYPPLKEIHTNYPNFFEQHAETLPLEDLQRYRNQYEVIGQILIEFEKQPDAPPPTDGQDSTPQTMAPEEFEKLGELLMKLQSYGYPPKEISGDMPPGWGFDPNSELPRVENLQEAAADCCIM